ncbi:hypothetical protein QJS10_CPB17g01815 [Acorus calamus]|uniref:Uncharacterized protein n=1 Tax=Acorus calamus TaxID=4465 RepID=A0AAV9CTK0_ACOCL|nr:hypothetical protein QJS10_CPB17g01815 [Acorus calamus]
MGCASSSHQFHSSVSVLRRLEEQNPAFFDVYKFRLTQEKLLHEGSQGGGASVPISNGFLKPPLHQNSVGYFPEHKATPTAGTINSPVSYGPEDAANPRAEDINNASGGYVPQHTVTSREQNIHSSVNMTRLGINGLQIHQPMQAVPDGSAHTGRTGTAPTTIPLQNSSMGILPTMYRMTLKSDPEFANIQETTNLRADIINDASVGYDLRHTVTPSVVNNHVAVGRARVGVNGIPVYQPMHHVQDASACTKRICTTPSTIPPQNSYMGILPGTDGMTLKSDSEFSNSQDTANPGAGNINEAFVGNVPRHAVTSRAGVYGLPIHQHMCAVPDASAYRMDTASRTAPPQNSYILKASPKMDGMTLRSDPEFSNDTGFMPCSGTCVLETCPVVGDATLANFGGTENNSHALNGPVIHTDSHPLETFSQMPRSSSPDDLANLSCDDMLDFSGILTFDDCFDDSMEWGYGLSTDCTKEQL